VLLGSFLLWFIINGLAPNSSTKTIMEQVISYGALIESLLVITFFIIYKRKK
jgi:hypothetical protein